MFLIIRCFDWLVDLLIYWFIFFNTIVGASFAPFAPFPSVIVDALFVFWVDIWIDFWEGGFFLAFMNALFLLSMLFLQYYCRCFFYSFSECRCRCSLRFLGRYMDWFLRRWFFSGFHECSLSFVDALFAILLSMLLLLLFRVSLSVLSSFSGSIYGLISEKVVSFWLSWMLSFFCRCSFFNTIVDALFLTVPPTHPPSGALRAPLTNRVRVTYCGDGAMGFWGGTWEDIWQSGLSYKVAIRCFLSECRCRCSLS